MLTLLYGRRGFFAPLLEAAGIQVVFAFTGARHGRGAAAARVAVAGLGGGGLLEGGIYMAGLAWLAGLAQLRPCSWHTSPALPGHPLDAA
jgi:hypothetical protein